MSKFLAITIFLLGGATVSTARFLEEFTHPEFAGETPPGWSAATGDGSADIQFIQQDGFASARIDATGDKDNIWWALIRRPIPDVDIPRLMQPEMELRVEARIRTSHAPRRVNLHFNHQRTTDYHSHLMEYDIPTAGEWHIISMTTSNFEVQPGDRIAAQMALMDWGLGTYQVDVDSFRVDVVDVNQCGQDLGNPLPYHPPVADPDAFEQHVPAQQDAIIDKAYPDLNFNDWSVSTDVCPTPVLAVSSDQWILLRWDLDAFKDSRTKGAGLLELTVHSLQRSPQYEKDFGMVRIVEILSGDPEWNQETVSWSGFFGNQPIDSILNGQMVIDGPIPTIPGDKALYTLNAAVMQRLIEGRTLGLAIRPLGAVHATFLASEGGPETAPMLHFSAEGP